MNDYYNTNTNITFTSKEAAEGIQKIYKKLHFSDMYGNAMVQFIVLTILLIGIHYYFKSLVNGQTIKKNWPNERCKPQNILLAGFINKPNDKSIAQYTQENFTYCVQSVLKTLIGDAVNPLVYVTAILNEIFLTIGVAINEIRAVFAYIRNEITSIVKEILARVLNILIPIQHMVIGLRDLMGKTQAIMVSSLYTFVGVYYALVSGLGSLSQFFLMIIALLLAIAAPLMAIPFTMEIGAAILAAAVAISVPYGIIAVTLKDTFGITPFGPAPKLCFDGETKVEMFDKTLKSFSEIKPGEKLKRGETVTAVLKLDASNVPMYQLGDVFVSGIHCVQYDDTWIPVREHPQSKYIESYDKPFIYCMNTSTKDMEIGGFLFSDWDELYQEKEKDKVTHMVGLDKKEENSIHTYLDGGFEKDTLVTLENGSKREIQNLEIGERLAEKSRVIGLVEIDGFSLNQQYEYVLGESEMIRIRGGPNLVYSLTKEKKEFQSTFYTNEHFKTIEKRETLYHILTDTGYFQIDSVVFGDYNSNIDFFQNKKMKEKNKE
jgi:hypothetical protein